MKLLLAYYGDPILRQKGKQINEIDEELRQLVINMIETMHHRNGFGIAAPQVHRSLALFITCVPIEQPDGSVLPTKPRVFINPKVLSYSEETDIHSEGCLSIPKVYGDVQRPLKISVQATNLEGEEFTDEFEGFQARCFLHENDHINGTLFIDRISGKQRKELASSLREVKKQYSLKSKTRQ